MDRGKNLAAVLPSRVSMFSLMATIPMPCRVRSAWIFTPSSKVRLNRSGKATTTVCPACGTSISARQPGRCRERPLATSVNQVVADAVLRQDTQLGLQVFGLVFSFADPGMAVSNRKGGHEVLRCGGGEKLTHGQVFRKRAFLKILPLAPAPALAECSINMFNNSNRSTTVTGVC